MLFRSQVEIGSGLSLDLSQWHICDEYTLVINDLLDDTDGYKKSLIAKTNQVIGIYNINGVLLFVNSSNANNIIMFYDTYL